MSRTTDCLMSLGSSELFQNITVAGGLVTNQYKTTTESLLVLWQSKQAILFCRGRLRINHSPFAHSKLHPQSKHNTSPTQATTMVTLHIQAMGAVRHHGVLNSKTFLPSHKVLFSKNHTAVTAKEQGECLGVLARG